VLPGRSERPDSSPDHLPCQLKLRAAHPEQRTARGVKPDGRHRRHHHTRRRLPHRPGAMRATPIFSAFTRSRASITVLQHCPGAVLVMLQLRFLLRHKEKSVKIIYDVGSNNGSDIPYYLHKADLVVAIEANPVLTYGIKTRFQAEIASGRLVVEGCGGRCGVRAVLRPQAASCAQSIPSALGWQNRGI